MLIRPTILEISAWNWLHRVFGFTVGTGSTWIGIRHFFMKVYDLCNQCSCQRERFMKIYHKMLRGLFRKTTIAQIHCRDRKYLNRYTSLFHESVWFMQPVFLSTWEIYENISQNAKRIIQKDHHCSEMSYNQNLSLRLIARKILYVRYVALHSKKRH